MAVLIRRLEEHDEVGHFDCGDDRLNNYLKRHAWQNQQKSSIGVTYVAIDEAAPRGVVGYFTLATASVPREAFPKKYVRGLPPYELPLILRQALLVGCIITDAYRDAIGWYARYGFVTLDGAAASGPQRMYLDIRSVRMALQRSS